MEYVPGMLFFGVKTLENVKFGKSVKRIGEAAFRGCSNLKALDLPESLETAGKCAFYETGLQSLFIPANVTDIGIWVGSSPLKQVICVATNAPKGSFEVGKDCMFYVMNWFL